MGQSSKQSLKKRTKSRNNTTIGNKAEWHAAGLHGKKPDLNSSDEASTSILSIPHRGAVSSWQLTVVSGIVVMNVFDEWERGIHLFIMIIFQVVQEKRADFEENMEQRQQSQSSCQTFWARNSFNRKMRARRQTANPKFPPHSKLGCKQAKQSHAMPWGDVFFLVPRLWCSCCLIVGKSIQKT